MTQRLPVSVFIIALNEADRISHAIDSVRDWVDEVIVIDSGSKDNTQEISREHGAKVLFNTWPGYGQQKRFGEEQCRNHWILNIDADEVISSELREEMIALFSNGEPSIKGYRTRIVEIMPGETAASRFAHSITAIRLYDIRHGRFSDSSVHDTVRMKEDAAGVLRGIVHHRSSRSISHSVDKLNRYSSMQAENMAMRGRIMPLLTVRLLIEFPMAFLKAYFQRRYIFKGMPGFVNAMIYAFSRFARVAKHYEMLVKSGKR